MRFPLNRVPRVTSDSESFKDRDFRWETEIPTGDHVGAFAHKRTHHIHEGIDLYTNNKAFVYAIHGGVVVGTGPFTGPNAGFPWWNDTQFVAVEDALGVWFYGEISILSSIGIGSPIIEGQPLGNVIQVLKTDKGRPMHMLHLERYVPGVKQSCGVWLPDTPQPEGLLDPTPLLLGIKCPTHLI